MNLYIHHNFMRMGTTRHLSFHDEATCWQCLSRAAGFNSSCCLILHYIHMVINLDVMQRKLYCCNPQYYGKCYARRM